MTLLATAQAFAQAGCCVIPTKPDGSKAPAFQWKEYQHHHPTADQLHTWFSPVNDRGMFDGLGLVCGSVSGGLEMLELEGRAEHLGEQLRQLLTDHGSAELWTRICSGYLERTPSGGIHWLYRVDGEAKKNTKLARRPGNEGTVEVLIETRGEGGYVVVAPSGGRTHPTGLPWSMLAGDPSTIPVISEDERDLLHALAAVLDEMPTVEPPIQTRMQTDANSGELRPGDDYENRATWDDILVPHGWKRTFKNFAGRGDAWCRPGKQRGVSATTGVHEVDRLYVFSSSTDFDTETPYTKFGAYAHLEHGGDHAAAASALRHQGYGAPLPPPGPVLGFVGGPTPPQINGQPAPEPLDKRASYGRHDDGNALRLVDTYGNTVRFCPQRGLWLRWTGHRWVWDEAEVVRELARDVARDLPGHDDEARKFRTRSLGAVAISNMVRLARTDERIVAHIKNLDARPYELNTPGGIVDLRTGKLLPPDPAALHTRSTSCAPDPDLEAPRWQRFLADTFAGDPELTVYVQRLLGASLIGQALEQILPFAFGSGANGKTTLLGAIQRIVGLGDAGYSISVESSILLHGAQQGHPTEIARLSGARLVITSELEDGQRFAEAKVKQLTGRDVLTGRFMNKDFFSFVPTHTLWALANHQPHVRAGGPALWRRMKLLPFLHTVPVDQRDSALEDHLVDEEGPAILAWCIQGAADYLAHGVAVPASVEAATKAYERDQDTLGRFIEDCCELGPAAAPHMKSKVAEIRAAYESWCHVEGEYPVTAKAFTTALKTRFEVMPTRSNATRWYGGIRLVDVSPEESRNLGYQETIRWDQQ